jgi:hypothetical protein
MTTESSARFQRLNDTNYAEWSLRMEAVLIRGGLWGLVNPEIDQQKEDGTEKDASTIALELEAALKARTVSKMNEARAEIILRLEDGQLSHCLRSNDPHVIWLVFGKCTPRCRLCDKPCAPSKFSHTQEDPLQHYAGLDWANPSPWISYGTSWHHGQ